ncbi:MAG: glycerol-3-phosphate dehydrogenase/oxidase [Gammaproteobacteria bacterium HGW-Gammaproteobacteria-3]|nr:MAG: glycerol-3-phosphate dehydrogenase/oxidase [Gammaproteobacteria bacterium HGW-Gammaproteobacteria-3]
MTRDFAKLDGQAFDAVICGGGIYGAWCAYDAALRGLKVALIDQGDWASGTSSASSKLIHGGLRYLEMFDFRLVGKTLKERQLLLQRAPHRVWPLRFGVPVYRGGRLSRFPLKLGLSIYDRLAGIVHSDGAHQGFSRAAFAGRFPSLDDHDLIAGFSYLDAQTDDARLVLELVAGAQAAGAVCVNYCRWVESLKHSGQLTAVKLQDAVSRQQITVPARSLLKTQGPWLSADEPCRLAKGVHLVLPALPESEALLLTAKTDGRVFFIMPWYGLTLLGTTDTDYRGAPDQVCVEALDIDYLLTEANYALKTVHWTQHDIIGRFAGLRVLKHDGKTAPSAVSRDWALIEDDTGVMTSLGGKITSARADAAVMIDRLCRRLGRDVACLTAARLLPWAPEGDYGAWTHRNSVKAAGLDIDPFCRLWLLRRYGRRVHELFKLIRSDPALAAPIVAGAPFIRAELLFCARREMVVHLDDLLRRRIPLLILARLSAAQLRDLAETVAAVLNWDEATVTSEIDRCRKLWPLQ